MVQRYDALDAVVRPCDEGYWVAYTDYAALERERDELFDEVLRLNTSLTFETIEVLKKENAKLRKRLELIAEYWNLIKSDPAMEIAFLSLISKNADLYVGALKAIMKCMEIKDGE